MIFLDVVTSVLRFKKDRKISEIERKRRFPESGVVNRKFEEIQKCKREVASEKFSYVLINKLVIHRTESVKADQLSNKPSSCRVRVKVREAANWSNIEHAFFDLLLHKSSIWLSPSSSSFQRVRFSLRSSMMLLASRKSSSSSSSILSRACWSALSASSQALA